MHADSLPLAPKLTAAAEIIGRGGVVVLSGAGLSTESGIPDYRDVDGAWLPGLNACLDTGNEARARRATHCSQEGPPVFAALRASGAVSVGAAQ